jgi:hypothetical protein
MEEGEGFKYIVIRFLIVGVLPFTAKYFIVIKYLLKQKSSTGKLGALNIPSCQKR